MRRLLVALVAVVALAASCGGGDDPASTTSSLAPSTTVEPTTSTSSAANTDQALWPVLGEDRFDTPEAAARSFAVDYLGMPQPSLGAFQQGDSRSGEIVVRPKTEAGAGRGPRTTILVRQLDSNADHWFVIGCTTPNLVLESHTTGDTITSPVTLRGQSTAFEAQILTGVREDGAAKDTYLGQEPAMGGANGEMRPFEVTVSFKKPSVAHGAIVLWVASAEDGSLSEATVVRVAFD